MDRRRKGMSDRIADDSEDPGRFSDAFKAVKVEEGSWIESAGAPYDTYLEPEEAP